MTTVETTDAGIPVAPVYGEADVAPDLAERTRVGSDTPLVLGGTVPAEDAEKLRAMGVEAVHPVGTSLPDVVAGVLALGARERTA